MKKILYIILMLSLLMLAGGCSTVSKTSSDIQHDTLMRDASHGEYRSDVARDSVYIYRTDSVIVRELIKGDTVYQTRDRYITDIQYRDREREKEVYITDTLVIQRTMYRTIKETEYRSPTFKFSDGLIVGAASMLSLAVAFAFIVKRLRRR